VKGNGKKSRKEEDLPNVFSLYWSCVATALTVYIDGAWRNNKSELTCFASADNNDHCNLIDEKLHGNDRVNLSS